MKGKQQTEKRQMTKAIDKAAFKTLSTGKLAQLYTAKEIRAFAASLGLELQGDARKKGVKARWVAQIKSRMVAVQSLIAA